MLIPVLISVGAITGLSTFLAILMVVADSTIANYGEVQVNINDKKELTVRGGKPLLGTLMDQELYIPSACGGRGSCGLCKVKVLEGGGDYLPTELPWITEEEKAENIRLSCQLKVKRDMRIEIPEELFSVRAFKAKVSSIVDLTHDIKEVTMDLLEPDSCDFTAGQFMQFRVPEYELSDEEVFRAYSIASDPKDKNRIQLEIRLVPNGICTTYVHNYLKEGQIVNINGPYGDFYLRESERTVICIAGGSGMAPIRSILKDMASTGINRKVRYFFGARTKKDLFLMEEMQELEKILPDFKFIPALSEPLPEDNWEGETGLITDVVARNMGPEPTEGYLCGSPGMIDACIKVLTSGGVPEELIFYDKF